LQSDTKEKRELEERQEDAGTSNSSGWGWRTKEKRCYLNSKAKRIGFLGAGAKNSKKRPKGEKRGVRRGAPTISLGWGSSKWISNGRET